MRKRLSRTARARWGEHGLSLLPNVMVVWKT